MASSPPLSLISYQRSPRHVPSFSGRSLKRPLGNGFQCRPRRDLRRSSRENRLGQNPFPLPDPRTPEWASHFSSWYQEVLKDGLSLHLLSSAISLPNLRPPAGMRGQRGPS